MGIGQEIEDFTRDLLSQRLQQLTQEQRMFFDRIFPEGVPKSKLETAIDLCDRTIKKNKAGRPHAIVAVEAARKEKNNV